MSSYSSAFDEALTKPLVTTAVPPKSQNRFPTNGNGTGTFSTATTRPSTSKPKTVTAPPPESFRSTNPFHDSNDQGQGQAGYNPPQLNDEESQAHSQSQSQAQAQQQQPLLIENDGTSAHSELEVALLQERHMETVQIHDRMRQIRDINLDLASLVEGQQEMVDEVEENAEQVYESARSGTTHLEKAQLLYKNTVEGEGFWKIFFTVLGGGGLILALIHLLSFL